MAADHPAAMLMTSLSANTLGPRSAEAIKISRSWSLRSLQIADQAIAETTGNASEISAVVCKRARAVGLHSLGMLSEVSTTARCQSDISARAGSSRCNQSLRAISGPGEGYPFRRGQEGGYGGCQTAAQWFWGQLMAHVVVMLRRGRYAMTLACVLISHVLHAFRP